MDLQARHRWTDYLRLAHPVLGAPCICAALAGVGNRRSAQFVSSDHALFGPNPGVLDRVRIADASLGTSKPNWPAYDYTTALRWEDKSYLGRGAFGLEGWPGAYVPAGFLFHIRPSCESRMQSHCSLMSALALRT